eukprot:3785176-Amphidinium_carterae.1
MPNCYASMDKKPLSPYHPLAYRSRLALDRHCVDRDSGLTRAKKLLDQDVKRLGCQILNSSTLLFHPLLLGPLLGPGALYTDVVYTNLARMKSRCPTRTCQALSSTVAWMWCTRRGRDSLARP